MGCCSKFVKGVSNFSLHASTNLHGRNNCELYTTYAAGYLVLWIATLVPTFLTLSSSLTAAEAAEAMVTNQKLWSCVHSARYSCFETWRAQNMIDPFSAQKTGVAISAGDVNGRSTWEMVTLVAAWYLCAVVTITSTKELMNRVRLPFLLCLSQFLFASLLSYAYLRWSKTLRVVPTTAKSVVIQIALSYTLGFILTNIAFSMGKWFHTRAYLT